MSGFADDSLIGDFVVESRENLDAIEPDLLAMEQQGANVSQEIINRVFRAIHSMKGGAGFLAFDHLKKLSHTMESVLMLVRDGALPVSPGLMDVLLAGVDKLRVMIDDIHGSNEVPIEDDIARLNAILSGKGLTPDAHVTVKETVSPAAPAGTEARSREFDLDTQAVRDALRHGKNLYRATVYMHVDLQKRGITPMAFLNNIESLGSCLDSGIDLGAAGDLDGCLENDLAFVFIFATVLEEDLVAVALELPEKQIVALDTASLKKPSGGEKAAPEPAEEPVAESAAVAPPPGDEAPPAAPKPEARKGGQADVAETLRVRVDLLTRLMNTAGELVLGRNQLLRSLEGHVAEIPGLQAILQNVDRVTTELQEGIMQTRMQPIGTVFGKFTRVVRDMARDLGKEIDLQVEGSEVELDKSIIELLGDPLTHIIRNCCDHALEPPEDREKAGKRRTGHIVLRAYHEGGQVNISIADDGRGISAEKVLAKAIEKGVVHKSEASRMSERDIINLIFAPGFSTAEKVSEVSGRGVGMDVVRTNIEKLGGHIDVDTAVGEGTTVLMRLPLTLAIIPSLVVGVSGQRFAVPQVNLVELVWVRAAEVKDRIEVVHGAAVLRLRGRLLPLVRIAEVLDLPQVFTHPETGETAEDRRASVADRRQTENGGEPDAGAPRLQGDRRTNWQGDYSILVLQVGSNQFGVIVDELFDSEEIVVKPLSLFIKNCRCFAGATILGDGRVIMILDASGLAQQAGLRFTDLEAEEKRRQEEEARRKAAAAAARRSIILFNAAPEDYFAVPQEKVLRLERIQSSAIESVGGREFVQYRGAGLPLVRLDHYLSVRPLPMEARELFLIIPKHLDGGKALEARAGIVVSQIVDAADVEVVLQDAALSGPGLQGSAIVQDKLTLFLDPVELTAHAGVLGSACS